MSKTIGTTAIPAELGTTVTGAIYNLNQKEETVQWELLIKESTTQSNPVPCNVDDYVGFYLGMSYGDSCIYIPTGAMLANPDNRSGHTCYIGFTWYNNRQVMAFFNLDNNTVYTTATAASDTPCLIGGRKVTS